jgi:GDP-L-fucose synthase
MNKNSKIFIAGAGGMVGSALVRELKRKGFDNLLTPNRKELNLLSQSDVLKYFNSHRPDYVIDAAAKVGGIHANNTYRADFIFQNLCMQNNLFQGAFENGVENFLFLGSSCIYPENAPQPMTEECLLTSPLAPTNEPYAIAKIAGLKLAESFRKQYGKNYFSAMPTNLYGVNDNFHPENSHVIPALVQRLDKIIKANEKVFEVWGTGTARREFLYVDDLAAACVYLLQSKNEIPNLINIGFGSDVTISELAKLLAEVMGFKGEIKFNATYPDGTMKKLMDSSKILKLGWKPQVSLRDGLEKTVRFYRENSLHHRSY